MLERIMGLGASQVHNSWWGSLWSCSLLRTGTTGNVWTKQYRNLSLNI